MSKPTVGKRRQENDAAASTTTTSSAPLSLSSYTTPPHALRLLQLIKHGSSDHAKEACQRLIAIASTSTETTAETSVLSSSSPWKTLLLWDILGRLLDDSSLWHVEWKVRTRTSQALEGVARQLPTDNQRDFLQRTSSDTETPFAIQRLDIAQLLQSATTDHRLLLLARSSDNDDATDQLQEKLDQLDQSRTQETSRDNNDEDEDDNFVQERLALQRQILARRLGLEQLVPLMNQGSKKRLGDTQDDDFLNDLLDASTPSRTNASKSTSTTDPGFVTSFHPESVESTSKSLAGGNVTKKRKRSDMASKTSSWKPRPPTSSGHDDGSSSTMRTLLLLEMQQQHRKSSNDLNKVGSVTAVSHDNPQTLLAGELLYRMFDPSWYVRHGAIQGILSLLRAWKDTATAKPTPDVKSLFGAWPQELLARCLCVLALDRFGDFSGTVILSEQMETAPSDKDPTGAVSSRPVGGVVAPVRESAGQLLAFLFAMAPRSTQETAFDMLFTMARWSNDWEVRHAALVSFKFIVVVWTSGVLSSGTAIDVIHDDSEWKQRQLEQITLTAVSSLEDPSDDVQSVSAQLLAEYLGRLNNNMPPHGWKMAPTLWSVLCKTQNHASCLVDLVHLLSILLESDCRRMIEVIGEQLDPEASGATTVLTGLLVRWLHVEFDSVKLSSLQCMTSLVDAIQSSNSPDQCDASAAFSLMVTTLFGTFLQVNNGTLKSETGSLLQARSRLWQKFCDALTYMSHNDARIARELDFKLTCRFFDVGNRRTATGRSLSLSIFGAKALAAFICRPVSEGKDFDPFIRFAVNCFLQSPWIEQCEAACLLIRELAHCVQPGKSFLFDGLSRVLLDLLASYRPLCLQVEEDRLSLLDTEVFCRTCDSAFLEHVSKETSLDASCIHDLWRAAFVSHSENESSMQSTVVDMMSMRVGATIAGAVVSLLVPPKLTPILRALITSLKNETDHEPFEGSRLGQTCIYLSEFLDRIKPFSNFAGARGKVLRTLCEMAQNDSDSDRGSPSVFVMRNWIRHLDSNETLSGIPELWDRIRYIRHDLECRGSDEDLRSSIFLLKAVAMVIPLRNETIQKEVETFVIELTKLCCCRSDEQLRSLCTCTLLELCTVDERGLLRCSLDTVVPFLRDNESDSCCEHACFLLDSLVTEARALICPFVKSLLSLVMPLMINRSAEVAKRSSRVFANLVRVAPLVRPGESTQLQSCASDEGQSVMDHLILGRPLPKCTFPKSLENNFRRTGIILRSYQVEGISWLRFLQTVRLNGALCDSMGLGKTLQSLVGIALSHDCAKGAGVDPKSLIVCPSSLVGHWVAEVQKFFPSDEIFRPVNLVGKGLKASSLYNESSMSANLCITSYAALRKDISSLSQHQWTYCVLDEGHLLKNPKTATARAASRLEASHKLILTGTPVQNRVNELWSIFHFLMPGFLGTFKAFSKDFALPITKSQQPSASADSISEGMEKLKVLHQQVLPFILRREKETVLKELPPKIVSVIKVPMSSLQSTVYSAFCSGAKAKGVLEKLKEAVEQGFFSDKESEAPMGSDVLKSLLFLRLLCTHPSLVASDSGQNSDEWYSLEASGKILAIVDLLRTAGIGRDSGVSAADNDSSLLYCDDDDDSSKGTAFDSIIDSAADAGLVSDCTALTSGRKCLLFAQFTKSLDVIEKLVFKPHMPDVRYLRLDGRVPARDRAEVARAFNDDPSVQVLLSTTRVGGLGLNLSGADTVLFLENDFNPFVDLQAMDRAHRIGQTKSVNVYSFVTENSIEERIMEVQKKKREVSDAIVNTDNSSLYSMGTDRLLDIFSFKNSDGGESEGGLEGTVDLDELLDRYSEDYASLSVEKFLRSLQ